LPICGCKASVDAKVNVNGEGKVADFDKPFEGTQRDGDDTRKSSPTGPEYALIGARQDLNYSGPPTPNCQCLAVSVGQPLDLSFAWEAAVPITDPKTQLVLAMSSQGITCEQAKAASLGASYQGYVIDGNDVVVLVEEAQPGRPLATGGIIPRPTPTSAVYIQPADKSVPYGAPLDGKAGRCKLTIAAPVTESHVAPSEMFKRPFTNKKIGGEPEPEPDNSR
jgi:hypothetical protein